MKKFKVIATCTTYYFAEIEANDENEAFLHAKSMNGSEFDQETYRHGEPVSNWDIYSVTEVTQ